MLLLLRPLTFLFSKGGHGSCSNVGNDCSICTHSEDGSAQSVDREELKMVLRVVAFMAQLKTMATGVTVDAGR